MNLIKIGDILINTNEIVSIRIVSTPRTGADSADKNFTHLKFGLTNRDYIVTSSLEPLAAAEILRELNIFLRGHSGQTYEIRGDSEAA